MKFYSHRKEKRKLDEIKISFLEKFLINIPNIVDYPKFRYIVWKNEATFELDPYYSEGLWKGMVNSRIDDYKRMIIAKKDNKKIEDVLTLYKNTKCGNLMICVCKKFN